ncbi:hypothetical protein CAL85_17345 [Shigella sonnei]|uniref:Nitrite extrusion protein 2 n=1 Tax=Shigella dysenteriae TaxID=622 RepID=A0A2S8D7Q0_SHIDY|nr:hypothetical protein [Shigella sonnei]PQN01521.1 hypothetical protein C5K18_21015 [Shigella dysenteriae]PQN95915.1 hypothetical protein C5K15_26360 [Shigella dysenteriae]
MTSLKTSIKTITYLSDTGCLEIQGASLPTDTTGEFNDTFHLTGSLFMMMPVHLSPAPDFLSQRHTLHFW